MPLAVVLSGRRKDRDPAVWADSPHLDPIPGIELENPQEAVLRTEDPRRCPRRRRLCHRLHLTVWMDLKDGPA